MTRISTHKIARLLPCSLSLLMLAGCTPDSLVDPDLEGTASFTVLDANTGAPVNDVTLEFVGGAGKKTSGEGQATFTKVRAGAYLIRLSKPGYETSQEPSVVATSGTEQVVAINMTQTFRIHRQGAKIKGRILLRPLTAPDTTATAGAPGVRVELRMTAAGTGSGNTVFLAPVRIATTTANGSYTFDSLPEISNYAVVVPEFTVGSKTYNQASTNVAAGTLLAGQTFTQTNSILSPAALGQMQVFARSLILASNQGWAFEFSSSVDTSKTPAASTQLRANGGSGTANIASTRTWNTDFTVLSIKPATGTWLSATTYSVVFSGVRDAENRTLALTTITANSTP